MKEIISSNLMVMALTALLFAIVIYVLVRYCIVPWIAGTRRGKHSGFWSWIEDHLSGIFILVWFYGFITYFIGTYVGQPGVGSGLLAFFSVIPMSVIHATEMFLGMSDISAIHTDRHENPVYMVLFDTSHFLAICVSLCFVFKHFGYYAVSKYRLHREAVSRRKYARVYVFWGVNESSVSLAESVIDHYRQTAETDYLIVFVKTPDEQDDDSHRLSIDRILNFASMKQQEMDLIDRLGNSLVANSRHRLSMLSIPESLDEIDVLGGLLHMKSLARIVARASRIHLFFLGDNREANVNATTNTLYDKLIQQTPTDIYCQTSKDSKTDWMEHYSLLHPAQDISIHIVDPAVLSVYQLKFDVASQPVSFVPWDSRTATPEEPFTSLVVGFRETGLEALDFLYEFGSFVDSEGRRARGRYVAIDPDMSSLRGSFYAKAPALRGNEEIGLVEAGIDDEAYWQTIEPLLADLNYVVIAVGDDNKGINSAVEICKKAYAAPGRPVERPLTVYVRSYDPENLSRISQVADDVNRTCHHRNIGIEIIGQAKQIFTYGLLVDERIVRDAKVYNFFYANCPLPSGKSRAEAIEQAWRQTLKLDRLDTEDMQLSDIIDIERKCDQNISNSLHAATKIHILEACSALPAPSAEILRRLSQLEHERWVAQSELSGWQRMTYEQYLDYNKGRKHPVSADPVRKLHVDICPWDEIRKWNAEEQKKTQDYDLQVVKSTIAMYLSQQSAAKGKTLQRLVLRI